MYNRFIKQRMHIPLWILPNVFLVLYAQTFVLASSHCDASDREYLCNCVFEPSNQTVFIEENGKYNLSSNHFVPAMKSLQYCQGSFQCKPNFIVKQPSEAISTESYIVCFNDDSCLSNGGFEIASLKGFSEACTKNSCMYLKDLMVFNITNAVMEVGVYMCIRVDPKDLKAPYCLKPACKSFVAIEKLCVCNYETRNCRCSSYCQNLLTSSSHKTYALFLSFGDIYTTKGNKGSFLHWIILFVLCIGLTILLIIFCRLCKAAVDPPCGNEVQNVEILRRILASNLESGPPSVSTTAKTSFSANDRCSPPPSYEQVLKDKCIEFKRSVT